MSIHHLTEIVADPHKAESLRRRFVAKVDKRGADECWPWVSKSVAYYGYGRMTAGRKKYLRAHQVAWTLANGVIPAGMSVLHTCNNTSCCNPAHLFLGTQSDNMDDARQKGRLRPSNHPRAEQHHNSKLKWSQVLAIRQDWRPAHVIAAAFGVSEKTIYRHRRRETWGCPS